MGAVIDIAANTIGLVAVGVLTIVAAWSYASGPGRRARQRRHDAWTRYIRRSYRGGESARGAG